MKHLKCLMDVSSCEFVMSLSLLLPKKIQNNLYKFLADSRTVKSAKSRAKSIQSYLEFLRIANRFYELCTFIFM